MKPSRTEVRIYKLLSDIVDTLGELSADNPKADRRVTKLIDDVDSLYEELVARNDGDRKLKRIVDDDSDRLSTN